MRAWTARQSLILCISLTLVLTLGVTLSMAQQKTKIAGKMTMAYTERKAVDVGDTEGHILVLAESEGVNVGEGGSKFMDGAQALNISFADLDGGNGPHQGYLRLTKGEDSIFAKWEGQVTTRLSPEGVPVTAFEGMFSYIAGTGQYKNIQGSGTYKGN